MKQARKGQTYACKVTALLLVLVMVLGLSFTAHAANDRPEGAVRLDVTAFHGVTSELFVYGTTGHGTLNTDEIVGFAGLPDFFRQYFPTIPVLYANVSTTLYFYHPQFSEMFGLLLDLEVILPNNSNMTMFCANGCNWHSPLNPDSPSPNWMDSCFFNADTFTLADNLTFSVPLTIPGTFVLYNDFIPYMFAVIVEGDAVQPTLTSPPTAPPQVLTPPIPTPVPTPIAEQAPSPVASRTITVVSGDSLYRIALRELGNGMRFGEIAALNNIAQPWVIFPGQELLLPLR